MNTQAQTKPQPKTYFFCTYRNKTTGGEWRKSHEYDSTQDLLQAMSSYLEQHPWTTVVYQTRTAWF